jgi:hypothetical protein
MFTRGILLAVSSLFAICLAANTQTTAADVKVEQELVQLEREWSTAVLKHDTATIDRILADDYIGIDGRGIITTKAQEMEEAKGPKPGDPAPPFVVLSESVTDMKVRGFENFAIVNGRVIEKIRANEKETEIQYRRTTVWAKRDGRWQCVSFHGSRILEPRKE